VCVSARSTSAKLIVPLAVVGSASSVTAPLSTAAVMVGASLLPVMVMVTSWVVVPPWPSSTVTV